MALVNVSDLAYHFSMKLSLFMSVCLPLSTVNRTSSYSYR